MFIDPYEVLGVDPDAPISVIRKRYFILAKKYHPDKAVDNRLFNQIATAYQILSNVETRNQYDSRHILLRKNKDGIVKIIKTSPSMPLKTFFFFRPALVTQSSLPPSGTGVYLPDEENYLCFSYLNLYNMRWLTGFEHPLKKRIINALEATSIEIYAEAITVEDYSLMIDQWLPKFKIIFNSLESLTNHEQLQQIHDYLSTEGIEKSNAATRLFKLNLLGTLLDCTIKLHEYYERLHDLNELWSYYLTQPSVSVSV